MREQETIAQLKEPSDPMGLLDDVGVFDLIDQDIPGWAEDTAFGQDIEDHLRSIEHRAKNHPDVLAIFDDFLERTEGMEEG